MACVACEFPHAMDSMNEFVKQQVFQVPPNMLWKACERFYRDSVRSKAEKEQGQLLPTWTKEAIETHYRFHVIDDHLRHAAVCRELTTMRTLLTSGMVTQDQSGFETIESKQVNEYIKLLREERAERALYA